MVCIYVCVVSQTFISQSTYPESYQSVHTTRNLLVSPSYNQKFISEPIIQPEAYQSTHYTTRSLSFSPPHNQKLIIQPTIQPEAYHSAHHTTRSLSTNPTHNQKFTNQSISSSCNQQFVSLSCSQHKMSFCVRQIIHIHLNNSTHPSLDMK